MSRSESLMIKYAYLAEDIVPPASSYNTTTLMDDIQPDDPIDELKDDSEDDEEKPNKALVPTEFYSNLYGYTGFEGAQISPMEYYSGSIGENPEITTNPWSETYQSASKKEKILIRTSLLKKFL